MSSSLEGHRVVYLLGIGGVGMSAGAELLDDRGFVVRGSDRGTNGRIRRLQTRGIPVDLQEDAGLLPESADLVVASSAIPPSHPLLVEARRRGVRVWKYADLVGALMARSFAVCVAGTHGKTTTSAMVASCLVHAERDPSFVVGGDLRGLGGGARSGRGAHFVAEACEFDRSFHRHQPHVAIVTNVDADHLDYYRDLDEIREAFLVFAARLPEDGLLVVHEPYAALFRGDARVRARIQTYGFEADADWRIGHPHQVGPRHRSRFALRYRGDPVGSVEIPLLGRHNALNAVGAFASLTACGLAATEIQAGLAAFQGVGRRLELIAERDGVLVFDDYGHHPAEILATLRAMRQRYADRRVILVFQPHQASRTRRLLAEFATALCGADEVWLPPIYYARDSEEERRLVSSEDLAEALRREGGTARLLPDLPAAVRHGMEHLRPGDVVVTMGAGNVDEVARGLADRLP